MSLTCHKSRATARTTSPIVMAARVCAAGALVLLVCAARLWAEDRELLGSFLAKHCVACHGADQQQASLRFDEVASFADLQPPVWAKMYEALVRKQMPPREEPQPTDAERARIAAWIVDQAGRTIAKTASPRRLNRREFSAALQDLTGLPIDFGAALPDDARIDGLDTGAEALQDAADSVTQLLEVTQRAVESIRFLEPASDRVVRIDFREHEFPDFYKFVESNWKTQGVFTRSKGLVCVKGVGLYLPTQWTGESGSSFLAVPPPADHRATLKITLRVRTQRPRPGLPIPILWVKVGGSYIDYRPIGELPQTLTYAVRMEDCVVEGSAVKVMLQSFVEVPYAVEGFPNDDPTKPEDNIAGGFGTYRPKFDRKVLRTPQDQPVPSIIVESVEVDYHHRAAWPPATWGVDLGQLSDDDATARRLLNLWVERAWRRPANEQEQEKFWALYRQLRAEELSLDEALRGVFQAVLMGGPFRYLASPTDSNPTVAQHAIASRLSFMLVGAPPDAELRRLAAAGQLRDPRVIDGQVERLLADPRSEAFFRPFVVQWLNLNQPVTVTMSSFKKQDFRFGRHLKESMRDETIQYVMKLVRENRPARELVTSDWTMMNDILAVHYGYPTLEGGSWHQVKVTPRDDDQRGGGILGHAGIQSMLCWMGDNWVIYRGAWALTHLLDDPPPPPPLEIPELAPFDKANQGKSFRELLIQHQADSRCSVCHRKLDPLGFAFQNFDLSGRWRNVEHEKYHRAELDGKIEWRGEGKTRPVDTSGALPRGERFTSFAEFKSQVADHYLDDIVRGLLKKLTLYGTGRSPTVLDLSTIHEIAREHASRDYVLRDVVKALVHSQIFLPPVVEKSTRVLP